MNGLAIWSDKKTDETNPWPAQCVTRCGTLSFSGLAGIYWSIELPEKFNIPLPLVEYQEPCMVFPFPLSGEALKRIDDTPFSRA
jgi:hypothetical protein